EMLKHIGMSVDEDRLDRAVRFSSFSEVKSQEERDGFIEKSATAERFFHAGGSGTWRTQISPEAADRFLRTHRKTMRAYGYTL
ncbi:MAG: sulfotransferase domain-containing protein, partial [Pseudomonadota bacterium]